MAKIEASKALSHLRVLDLTRVRAGPVCVRHLADFGADVIKIENVSEESYAGPREGPDFQNLHRNKRSMTLNLKSDDGLEVFKQLVKTADVIVENYRPDVKFRLGIDYESMKIINPRIIYASISGFGQDGPYVNRPGFDQITQGMSGLMSVTGTPGEGPMRVGGAVTDVAAGLLAAMGILTALVERDQSGEGQWVQSNLLQAGLTLLDFQAARYTMKGEVAKQVGNDHPTFMPTSAYPTADGYMNVAATGMGVWEKFAAALGRDDLLNDEEFKIAKGRSDGRARLNAEISRTLRTRSTAQWVDHLLAHGVPCGPIYNMDQVFADPQVQHIEASAKVTHPTLGELTLLNQSIGLSRTPASLKTSTPMKGEHTEEVLTELGFTAEKIAALKQVGSI
ncbi:CoA transferase [Polynucleobacter sp. SHI8]|uniref:CaiB/BaiF CoA transferase family protein n=1 Tax=unclassified Polynucleobacter TaxID=2640945 RepID=UPI0024904E68|nr:MULTISPECIES: CoA transferase [unclassified Polynucleobacter]BDW10364.1 CoA transferase [Polynucleobacter sp. SHI2]BDW12810.1 CoA transferase [Polynucleobacter sp. SHI8]